MMTLLNFHLLLSEMIHTASLVHDDILGDYANMLGPIFCNKGV